MTSRVQPRRVWRWLDTNGDGRLDSGDDPYAPYWPGAAYVDWVGMSLYHWGTTYPWGANTVPTADKFAQMIAGTTTTSRVPIPNFYADYAERYDKPLAIVETAAFYRPGGGGAAESAIKAAWLAEVFSAATRSRFPLLRIVNWFDWRITADPRLRALFLAAMTNGFRLGPAVPKATPAQGCSTPQRFRALDAWSVRRCPDPVPASTSTVHTRQHIGPVRCRALGVAGFRYRARNHASKPGASGLS